MLGCIDGVDLCGVDCCCAGGALLQLLTCEKVNVGIIVNKNSNFFIVINLL